MNTREITSGEDQKHGTRADPSPGYSANRAGPSGWAAWSVRMVSVWGSIPRSSPQIVPSARRG